MKADLRAGDETCSASCAEGVVNSQNGVPFARLNGTAGASGAAFGLAALGAYFMILILDKTGLHFPS